MRRTLTALAVAGLILAGCGEDGAAPDQTAGQTLTAVPPTATEPTPSEPNATEPTTGDDSGSATPFPANTETDRGDPVGAPSTVVDVRIGRHPGYDRVVFDTAGGGRPGWTVGYVDEATAQGSGERIDVAGDAILEVTLTNTGYPLDTGVDEFAQDMVDGADVVTEVHYVGVFEGHTQAFIGLEEQQPFRARALDAGEGRVLVEIWD